MAWSCVQKFSFQTHAGSMSTEPAHTVLLSVRNNDKNSSSSADSRTRWQCLGRWQDGRSRVFCFEKTGCTYHLCHHVFFMGAATAVTASISSSFFSSSISNNLEDTGVVYFGHTLEIAVKAISVHPKLGSGTHTFVVTWRHSCLHRHKCIQIRIQTHKFHDFRLTPWQLWPGSMASLYTPLCWCVSCIQLPLWWCSADISHARVEQCVADIQAWLLGSPAQA